MVARCIILTLALTCVEFPLAARVKIHGIQRLDVGAKGFCKEMCKQVGDKCSFFPPLPDTSGLTDKEGETKCNACDPPCEGEQLEQVDLKDQDHQSPAQLIEIDPEKEAFCGQMCKLVAGKCSFFPTLGDTSGLTDKQGEKICNSCDPCKEEQLEAVDEKDIESPHQDYIMAVFAQKKSPAQVIKVDPEEEAFCGKMCQFRAGKCSFFPPLEDTSGLKDEEGEAKCNVCDPCEGEKLEAVDEKDMVESPAKVMKIDPEEDAFCGKMCQHVAGKCSFFPPLEDTSGLKDGQGEAKCNACGC